MLQVHQGVLVQHLKTLFPGEELCENTRKQSQIKSHPNSSHYLELDVWLPKRNLCFEFQDEYHFVQVWYKHEPINNTYISDSHKRSLAWQKGLKLITVPCWWDGNLSSLASAIAFECPDLGITETDPIPLNPPLDFFQVPKISGVGELMLASFPTDSDIILLHNWWVGEKYDGIRCCWNSQLRKLYSRVGNELILSPAVRKLFPSIFVDCEMWAGRGHFAHTISFIKSASTAWDLFRIVAFDSPATAHQSLPFEDRYAKLLSIPSRHPFFLIAPRIFSKQGNGLKLLQNFITENEGEGIIMRKLGSQYESGRSLSLLKLKSNLEEYEGIVIEIQEQSITIELPNGNTLVVPRENVLVNPSLGDVVTFSFDLSTQKRNSIPTNIQVFRIRNDLTWRDVVRQYLHESGQRNSYLNLKSAADMPSNATDAELSTNDNQTNGWSNPETRRHFFEKYATENRFNPLIPANWYSQSKNKILSTPGAKSVLNYHGHSISRAIIDLFPEIELKPSLWTRSLWKEEKTRRDFFEKYAKENGFDFLSAEHWYSQSKNKILSAKGVETIIKFHGNDVATAIRDLFPEINFKPNLWTYSSVWKDPRNRRKFFEKYARDHGFDPLNPKMWYQHHRSQIMSTKGASRIIKYHGHSITQALRDLFPEFASFSA